MVDRAVRAFWVTEPGQGAIRPAALPSPGAGDVLVETLFSGISRGTEALVFGGRVPASEHARMRCPFQEGEFPAPVKYGYAAVGRIAEGPSDAVGRIVFVLHPHQSRFVVPLSATIPVPAAVPPGRAVLAANMETALNGVWDAGIGPGDRVCVVGAGVVGALVAVLAAGIPGVSLTLLDIDAGKASLAHDLGLAFRSDPAALEPFDVVVHASGDPGGLRTALTLADVEATVVEMSWFGDREAVLPLGGGFHSQRLTIRSSQVGALPPLRRPRWSHRRRLQAALGLLTDDRLDRLISGESAFESLPEVMPAIASGALPALCHRIRYS